MDEPTISITGRISGRSRVAEEGTVPFMRHLVMRLPEESKAEFIYMVPSRRGEGQPGGWMVADDGADMGSSGCTGSAAAARFGPAIENRIIRTRHLRQVSLWDQRGSRVIRAISW